MFLDFVSVGEGMEPVLFKLLQDFCFAVGEAVLQSELYVSRVCRMMPNICALAVEGELLVSYKFLIQRIFHLP